MKEITLTNSSLTIQIDDEDYARVNYYWWNLTIRNNRKEGSKYLIRTKINGLSIYVHRFILNEFDPNIIIDHKDRNRFNNQKDNLRRLNKNSGLNIHNHLKSYRSKGVSFHSRDKVWQASIQKDKIKYHLGQFSTREDAIRAYNSKSSELYGDNAILTPVDMS